MVEVYHSMVEYNQRRMYVIRPFDRSAADVAPIKLIDQISVDRACRWSSNVCRTPLPGLGHARIRRR